jgi:hypothetical protein
MSDKILIKDLDAAYKAISEDVIAESEAKEWADGIIEDVVDET